MLALRAADLDDEQRLLAWRNDPQTRAASFDEGEVSAEEHGRWLRRKLGDESCTILVGEVGGEVVGVVRFDRDDATIAEVSVIVAPAARGRGMGVLLLRSAVREAQRQLGIESFRARVKEGNRRSLGAFAAAGFTTYADADGVVELRLGAPPPD